MSLADRPYMQGRGARHRPIRLDHPPPGAIDMAGSPSRARYSAFQTAREGLRPRSPRRHLLGLLAASAGLIVFGWAVACGMIGASLKAEGGTFVPPTEVAHGPR